MKALRMLAWAAALSAAGYVVFCVLVVRGKEAILYPTDGRVRANGRQIPAGTESWWLPTADGGRSEAWWRPLPGADGGNPAPVVIYFHGNAELIDDQRQMVELWHKLGASVLLCEHAGYGRGEGRPSIAQDVANAAAWHDLVAARPEVKRGAVIAHGFSFGGALAAQLAAQRPVAGLILESTFSSLPSMARGMGVWLYLDPERLDSARALRELDPGVPVLITHGTSDAVISIAEGRALADARPGARYHEDSYPHIPWAQDEPGHGLLRELLAAALVRAGTAGADNALASAAPGSARSSLTSQP